MLLRSFSLAVLLLAGAPALAADTPAADPCSTQRLLSRGGSFATASDGVRIWYKLAGREGAPVIAYLHGGPGYNAYAFEESAGRLLEETFRVLYLDQRGCGRSTFDGPIERYGMQQTIDDLEHLRTLIGAERLILTGHSFGGAVAAAYTARYPTRVAAVVMIDTTHDMGRALQYQVEHIDSIADTAFADKAQQIRAIARSSDRAMGRLGKLYGAIGRLPLQRKLHYADPANQESMETLDRESGFLNCTSGNVVEAFSAEGYLSKALPDVARPLGVPALLIAGRDSHVIGAENVRSAAQAWNAEVEWLDAGHFVYFERPREFAQAIERFVEKISFRSDAR